MEKKEVDKLVKNGIDGALMSQYGIDANEILPEKKLDDDFKSDELDYVELLMRLERDFNVAIPDEDFYPMEKKMPTVQHLYDYMTKRLSSPSTAIPKAEGKTKEAIYDNEIAPLMTKIIEVCKRADISVFADFQYSKKDFCTTAIHNKESHIIINIYNMLSQCKEGTGINIDKFYIHFAKNYPNKSSIVMEALGNKATSNT